MNEKIFNAALELEKIYDILANDDLEDDEKIDAAVAREHREKMFGVMRKFFAEESRDDFVTLFGIYCNIYVKNNFHQVLPDENFGVAELWDVVTDEKFQTYLLKIRHGIFEQDGQDFFDAIELFDEYSLPHLYLFVFTAEGFDEMTGDDDSDKRNEFLEFMQEHYNKMNAGLREYVLGTGKFIRENLNPGMEKNFLPYVKVVDKIQDTVFDSVKGMINVLQDETGKSIEEISDYLKKPRETEEMVEIIRTMIYLTDYLLGIWSKIFPYGKLKKIMENLPDDLRNQKISWSVEFNVPVKDEWRNKDLVCRVAFLNIPVRISNAGNFLLDQMEKLRLQREKEKIRQSKDKLVKDFTHRYKNLRATRLGEIAESLLRMDDEQQKLWGRELLLEQARKETLNKEAAMLNLRYNDKADELVKLLKNSLADKGEGIAEILQTAIFYCVIELLYDFDEASTDAEIMRDQMEQLWGSLDDKKISFEREVISDKKNCGEWLTENGLGLQIDINERWQKISVQPNNYAEIFLRAIFVELFKNFLKHGEIEKPAELKFHSDATTLKVSMRNAIIEPEDFSITSTRYGLSSMDETLKTLYVGEKLSVPEKCVRYTQDVGNFFTELEMPAKIFLREATTNELR